MRTPRTWYAVAIVVVAAAAICLGGIVAGFRAIGPPPLARLDDISRVVVDRRGEVLRAYTTERGRWRLPVDVRTLDPLYLKMLKVYEDRRFDSHQGVDPLATLRSTALALWHWRIVSGASTLSMQAARLLDGVHERTAVGKARQALRALQLEHTLGKARVLKIYLDLAPFGGNIEGVRAASFIYFGKEPTRLSLAESALLVALPQSPEWRRPDKYPVRARAARDRVLDRAAAAGLATPAEIARAKAEPVPVARRDMPMLAPHLADLVATSTGSEPVIRLTLDRTLQASIETVARAHVQAFGQGVSAAVIVIEHATGAVRAEVASAGYLDQSRQGAVDMARAMRSPGSTLKPLIYGLAFDAGIAHPDTLIDDEPVRFGLYRPKNFDTEWNGTVSIREALARSLNIPAVKVLDRLGAPALIARLRTAGTTPGLPGHGEPTLAVALGGLGLTLRDVATLYTAIARGGEAVALHHEPGNARTNARLMTPVAAWYLADILRHAPAPTPYRSGQIAYKTGTSYGYRDAWSVGFDARHTIAVWVGRPDGAAVAGLTGRTTAAPLLFDAFRRVGANAITLPRPPAGAITRLEAGSPLAHFGGAARDGGTPGGDAAVTIAFPPDRAELSLAELTADGLTAKAEGGALPLTWLVNGVPLSSDPGTREIALSEASAGFLKLTVIDAQGRSDRVVVRLR
jgi:penicillin-binding protein 1C